MTVYDAVVVGSGPNGLAAAAVLARAGRSVHVIEGADTIGGGTRTGVLNEPGFFHDLCSAIHPAGAGSPAFTDLDLEAHGLEYLVPDIDVAHPLDDGTAVAITGDVTQTAAMLGADGDRYAKFMGPIVESWPKVTESIMQPLLRFPRHPVAMARFGLAGLMPATMAAPLLGSPRAQALFGGLAAHAILPLNRPLTTSFGLVLAASGHIVGWPIAKRGSQSIADALASIIVAHGGTIETGRWVASLDDLPRAKATLLDLSPRQLIDLGGDRLPPRYRRQLARFRAGPGACKVDFALDGPVPWRAPEARRAGTVHLGGSIEEIAFAEAMTWKGGHPERPYVLVAQQSLYDDSRAPEGKHTLWTYCHVPNGSDIDMSDKIEAQIERFAPGFRDLVIAKTVRTARAHERYNPTLMGGDITGGAHLLRQMVFRPVPSFNPYRTPLDGVYLCSASTPPGGGVHGMCGYNAAHAALARELR